MKKAPRGAFFVARPKGTRAHRGGWPFDSAKDHAMTDDRDAKPELDDAPDTPGGEKPIAVEERPNVGTVTPDDYPDRKKPA